MLELDFDTQVRVATHEDADDLIELCRMMHAETALRDAQNVPLSFCPDKARSTLELAIPRGRNDVDSGPAWIGVVGGRGDLKASSYLMLQTPWYSQEPYLAQLWTFVLPEFRARSSTTKDLIAFSQMKARQLQLRLVMGVLSTGPGMERMYERTQGCERIGSLYGYSGTAGVTP